MKKKYTVISSINAGKGSSLVCYSRILANEGGTIETMCEPYGIYHGDIWHIAAFDGGDLTVELARILRKVAEKIEDKEDYIVCRDINGNKVGMANLID